MTLRATISIWTVLACLQGASQTLSPDTLKDQRLDEVEIVTRRPGTVMNRGVVNAVTLTDREFTKAACCNLGESFTTNPSVDVSYSDAATGARQIKLLGLSGTYVQMMTENIPNFRGSAAPFALGYVPGPWMQSIQVSKGTASVKNGFESMTGQINIEYQKPQLKDQFNANVYGSSMAKFEANADAAFHLTPHSSAIRQGNGINGWSMGVLAHYEDRFAHTDHNHDGFADAPDTRQYNAMLRWAYFSPQYIFQSAVRAMKESRNSGQLHAQYYNQDGICVTPLEESFDPNKLKIFPFQYGIEAETHRYEAFLKNAYIFDAVHNSNVALILNGSFHQTDALFGWKEYDVIQRDFLAQLLFETDFSLIHSLSAGLSLQHSHTNSNEIHHYQPIVVEFTDPHVYFSTFDKVDETTPGAYVQYTLNLSEKLVLMAGIRADHTRIEHGDGGTFFTPRTHLKYQPNSILTLRASVGKGHRYVNQLADNFFLLSSGRAMKYAYEGQILEKRDQYTVSSNDFPGMILEEAWNSGLSAQLSFPLFGRTMQLNAEYYYTHFTSQFLVDYDQDAEHIYLVESHGKNRNHCFQADLSYPIVSGLEFTAAYRRNIVRSTYGGKLQDKPLQSKYKALLAASYKTPLGLWQFDVTLQLNGGGRMPTPYYTNNVPSWSETFNGYEQLNVQLTRWFRHFSIYAGGENLTGYRQKNPIVCAHDPWSRRFDPTLVYGPTEGAMLYVGARFHLERY